MKSRWIGMGALVLALHPGLAAAQRVADERLSAAVQRDLAQRAIDICAARGAYVAVAVTGPDRVVRTLLSHDKASFVAIQTAQRKAVSAVLVGYPTAGLTKAVAEAPAYVDMLRSIEPTLITIGGGLPIRSGGTLIGGIGVGGAAGPEADAACASEALAAVVPEPPR